MFQTSVYLLFNGHLVAHRARLVLENTSIDVLPSRGIQTGMLSIKDLMHPYFRCGGWWEALGATQGSAPRYIGILWVEDLGTGRIQLRDLIIDSIL